MCVFTECVYSLCSSSVMPVCDICSEQLACDSELKTHLLLTHLENEVTCPLCPLSGVSFNELNFDINTAHSETGIRHTPATGETGHPECELETGACLSTVSWSPETHDGVKKPIHRPAGETSRRDGKHENTQEDKMMEPFTSKHRRLTSPSKGDLKIRPVFK